MKFHKDGTVPKKGETFVFGSNLAGRHGGGAARAAQLQFGAEPGVGIGPTGNSYAIPTKDLNIETLPMAKVKKFVAQFVKYARNRPDEQFFVTRVGCVLAGFSDAQMSILFEDLPNCSYALEWKPYLKTVK